MDVAQDRSELSEHQVKEWACTALNVTHDVLEGIWSRIFKKSLYKDSQALEQKSGAVCQCAALHGFRRPPGHHKHASSNFIAVTACSKEFHHQHDTCLAHFKCNILYAPGPPIVFYRQNTNSQGWGLRPPEPIQTDAPGPGSAAGPGPGPSAGPGPGPSTAPGPARRPGDDIEAAGALLGLNSAHDEAETSRKAPRASADAADGPDAISRALDVTLQQSLQSLGYAAQEANEVAARLSACAALGPAPAFADVVAIYASASDEDLDSLGLRVLPAHGLTRLRIAARNYARNYARNS